MRTQESSLVVLALHARDTPAPERTRAAESWRSRLAGRGALVLETCHRVEAYLATEEDPEHLADWLPGGGRLHAGEAAVRHAVSVAVGLDSVVLGEDQVLSQSRQAVTRARDEGLLDPLLEQLFARALGAGRRARSWQRGPAPSLADLAIAQLRERAGPLQERDILVVGAGEMGFLVTRAALASGARVWVASRTEAHAADLASRLGADVAPFDPGPLAGTVAGIVVALRGPWRVDASTERVIGRAGNVVIDLSTPAALSDDLASRLGPRYLCSDDLAHITATRSAAEAHTRDAHRRRLSQLVDATTEEFLAWLAAHRQRAVMRALAEHAEHARQAEMTELWRRLPGMEPGARDAIEQMSRHLSQRLLREPFERLRRDRDGRRERAARELFGL